MFKNEFNKNPTKNFYDTKLTNLALLSIESDIVRSLDFPQVVENFASIS